MSQTLNLYRLQQTDLRIDRAKDRMIEIQSILHNDTELQSAITAAEKADYSNKEIQRLLHSAEADAQNQSIKIKQTEASLYSGIVKNPKELQDIQSEVASLKRHYNTLEDRLLEVMMACENAESIRRQCHETVNSESQRVNEQHQSLSIELEELIKENAKLTSERKAISGSIPNDMILLYENLRNNKRGIAISVAMDFTCSTCGNALSPAQNQAIHTSSQLIYCTACGRILHGI